ncbi:hypothetical protein NX794_06425 [Streptomyces sp. LP11]|uniref:Secreted protein n=1 Tax=Streptomyces pyxinicus TaxID=2970331 RepID=A0ABT2AX85_9ACTN|nr:hypothetical protein [Streptomyces sp. LP11]MCS0600866.1 hypothetical protein [Streptomyces sp. LP11]
MNRTFALVVRHMRATAVVTAAVAALLGAVAVETEAHGQRTATVQAGDSSTDNTNPWS